jgi:hypothetical protein
VYFASVGQGGVPVATIKSEFNERLYEFGVNFELVTSLGALIAGYIPGIPSPQDETELGWDAEVELPAFGQTFLLQYKVARRTTARAGANTKFWDVYNAEYYRFSLHRDVAGSYTQHQLLLDAHVIGVEPLYCAPLMHRRGDLVRALQSRTLIQRSALIPVATLGPATPGVPHSVTYPVDEVDGQPTLHSEPHRGERLGWEDLQRSRAEARRALDERVFDDFSSVVLERRRRRRRKERTIRAEDPRAASYLRAAAVAHDELGATLVVVP